MYRFLPTITMRCCCFTYLLRYILLSLLKAAAVHVLCIDFEKAFDKVNHKKLWKVIVDMGFAKHLVALIRTLYENQKSNVRIHGETSSWFQAKQGVRQGCILSSYLFNLMAELLMRKALDGCEGGFKIGGRCITNLRYADDIVLIASTEEELRDIVNRLHEAATEPGIKINGKKTEVMKVCYNIKSCVVRRAYPIAVYPAVCRQAAAIMHMIMNNLDPTVAQFPQELVCYGGNGQVFGNWAQVCTCSCSISRSHDSRQ